MSQPFPQSLIPANEAARLRSLHLYQIVNTTPEKVFDEYVAWVAQLFNTPIALISLVDAEQTWHKALFGAEAVPSLPRELSMCSAAILQDEQVVISDYAPSSCELIKPDVAQAYGLQFYAGAALQMPDGARIGMLVVIGREPRGFSSTEADLLSELAGLVGQTIELRLRYRLADDPAEWAAAQQELTEALDENAALARYLTTRSQYLNLDDETTLQAVRYRLKSLAGVLARRLAATAAHAPLL